MSDVTLTHPTLPGARYVCSDVVADYWRDLGWVDAPDEPPAEPVNTDTGNPASNPEGE